MPSATTAERSDSIAPKNAMVAASGNSAISFCSEKAGTEGGGK